MVLKMMLWIVLLGLLAHDEVAGFREGAPDRPGICKSMKPGHRAAPMSLPPPFTIHLSKLRYEPGETITVTIRAKDKAWLKGFLIEGRRADWQLDREPPIGFFAQMKGTGVVCATTTGNGLTHTDGPDGSETPKKEIRLLWTAPKPSQGHVEFHVTAVQSYDEYWVAEKSSILTDPNAKPIQPRPTEHTSANIAISPITLNECGITKGCYRNPPECDEPACDAVVTWQEHDQGDVIDFELSGQTDGWVAVAFSEDKLMGKDSVVECVWNERETKVVIRRSWNIEGQKMNEVVQDEQLGLSNMGGYYSDGRVKCRFTLIKSMRSVTTLFDLADAHYLIVGKGPVNKDGFKEIHTMEPFKFPMVSTSKVLMAKNVDISGRARYTLVKAHGCLMIIAWMMCASVAIIMARYYKPMWPNNRICNQRVWFAVHRGCNLMTMFCTILGFILIFVHVGGYSQMQELPMKAHPPLGITVTVLAILNPLIAICRCKPEDECRPVFNWIHWFIGTVAFVLQTPTLFIGLSLAKAFVPWWATWVMVAFMFFHLICELLLEIHGCINARKQKQRNLEYEMRKKNDPRGELDGYEPEPVGTNFKKIIITLYLFVAIILGIVMVITVAIS